jgi:hypothetical protein
MADHVKKPRPYRFIEETTELDHLINGLIMIRERIRKSGYEGYLSRAM